MALPPEQINIKRRREEEPVETLYIQSELHQTKRRFTDFVFQRVQVRKDGTPLANNGPSGHGLPGSPGLGLGLGSGSGSGTGPGTATGTGTGTGIGPGTVPEPARQRVLRTPRSVSSLIVAKGANRSGHSPSPSLGAGAGAGGVPLVRATSPGAEIREEKRLAAQRKEKEDRLRRAVYESPSASGAASPVSPVATRDNARDSPVSPGKPIRRFQISRTSATAPMNLHRSFDGGVQKRKGAGGDGVAVLVEKLRKTHSRQASQDVFGAELDPSTVPSAGEDASGSGSESRPRKRPVVNQAERKWREARKNAISAAKENISNAMDRGARARGGKDSTWDDESDRLASEFERIALELDGPASPGSAAQTPQKQKQKQAQSQSQSDSKSSPSPLKYQPRTPNKPRCAAAAAAAAATATKAENTEKPEKDNNDNDTDSEDDYVYDVYVRRPLTQAQIHAHARGPAQPESQSHLQPPAQPQFQSQSLPTNLKNPLAELEHQNALLSTNVGVIVITQEDEIYWENFIEDEDDEEWDSEDADSNAENNPANDYPDEELSWDDSDDDVFMRYRQAGFDDFGSGSEDGYGYDYDSDY